MQPTDLVDINEAARVTGLHPQTLYRLARQRRIRSFTVLKRALRFQRIDLERLLTETPADPPSADGPACAE